MSEHRCEDLIALFDRCFADRLKTRLVKGESEPLYLPRNEQCEYHTLIFAHGFFSSALHEIAHWCVAGPQRRQLEDFGYWYKPDGRTEAEQQIFEQVEVKPQALEWIFSVAAGCRFRVSADNLSAGIDASSVFKDRIYHQVLDYLQYGLPVEAQQFVAELTRVYTPQQILSADLFNRNQL